MGHSPFISVARYVRLEDTRRTRYEVGMCRSIKVLRDYDEPASDEDIQAAALQYVRKISGFRKPSKKNEEAFEQAVAEVTRASRHLLDHLQPTGPKVASNA